MLKWVWFHIPFYHHPILLEFHIWENPAFQKVQCWLTHASLLVWHPHGISWNCHDGSLGFPTVCGILLASLFSFPLRQVKSSRSSWRFNIWRAVPRLEPRSHGIRYVCKDRRFLHWIKGLWRPIISTYIYIVHIIYIYICDILYMYINHSWRSSWDVSRNNYEDSTSRPPRGIRRKLSPPRR